jgi:hypothetical protein
MRDDTVVAGAVDFCKGHAAYVFVKPLSGWSSATETAMLAARKVNLVTVAASNNRIVASDNSVEYVFHKPTGGWRTTSTPNARLKASGGAALGSVALKNYPPTVAAAGSDAAYIFAKPR